MNALVHDGDCRDLVPYYRSRTKVFNTCVLYVLKNETTYVLILREQGGLHEIFSEIDFLVVSDRGDRYLSEAFSPLKKYCS